MWFHRVWLWRLQAAAEQAREQRNMLVSKGLDREGPRRSEIKLYVSIFSHYFWLRLVCILQDFVSWEVSLGEQGFKQPTLKEIQPRRRDHLVLFHMFQLENRFAASENKFSRVLLTIWGFEPRNNWFQCFPFPKIGLSFLLKHSCVFDTAKSRFMESIIFWASTLQGPSTFSTSTLINFAHYM